MTAAPRSGPADRLFALVDCNNFYVSAERAFFPRLRGRPVVVLSNGGLNGCIVARSSEVKALGVQMGTPWFQLKDLARRHGIVALNSNYTLYGDMSNRVMTILREFSPSVEVYSIDEAFLLIDDLARLWPSPEKMGQAIRARVLRETGLPVCVGIAQSKTLAKLANYAAKKRPEFDGVCDLAAMPATQRDALFASIEVGEVWGVGRKYGERLQTMRIETVADLRNAPPALLRSRFGVVMERTGLELRGVSCLDLEQCAPAKQQIMCSRSFGEMVLSERELAEAVSSYITRAAEKLRTQHSICGAVHVFIATNRFRVRDRQYSNGGTIGLAASTADTRELAGAALVGLHRIYRPGFLYKKAGVMLLELSPASQLQGALFESASTGAAVKVMAALDAVNRRFGKDTLTVAAAGVSRSWSMRADRVSPRYTTSWSELPIASAK